MIFFPVNPADKVNVSLYLSNSTSETPQGVICQADASLPVEKIQFRIFNCNNVSECQLKVVSVGESWAFRTTGRVGAVAVPVNASSVIHGKVIEASEIGDGVILCSSTLKGFKYGQNLDYIFKGLDSAHYLHAQSPPPDEAIINLTQLPTESKNEAVRGKVSVRCTISTLILLPQIQFTLHFSGGKPVHVLGRQGLNSSKLKLSEPELNHGGLRVLSQTLEFNICQNNVINVTCSAPKIVSAGWATSTIPVQKWTGSAGTGKESFTDGTRTTTCPKDSAGSDLPKGNAVYRFFRKIFWFV